MHLGQSGPKRAIYATSDAVSFALATFRDELSHYFYLYQPGLETLMGILDKGRLMEHATAVGIETPETWLPASRNDAERFAREIDGTILVKPRSQLSVRNYTKGAVTVSGVHQVLAAYDRVLRTGVHDPEFARRYPEIMLPMLQRYHTEAMDRVYSLSGFRDKSGKHVAMLGAYKVLQRPRRLGIGLCFEEAAVEPEIAERVGLLCDRVGYYGAFEIEFILCGGRHLLIDFNARFYNQMALDIARGLELPRLVYAAAIGCEDQVAQLIASVPEPGKPQGLAFRNMFGVHLAMAAQRALGTISRKEAARWRKWHKAPGRRIVDAVFDADDPIPAAVEMARQAFQSIRHPRAFVRSWID
jgi:predicted ATP-grasp superfamily ATP-dependent carboligase